MGESGADGDRKEEEARTAFTKIFQDQPEWKCSFWGPDAPELSPAGFEAPGQRGMGYHRCSFRMAASGIWQMHYTDVLYLFPVNPPYVPTESDGYL